MSTDNTGRRTKIVCTLGPASSDAAIIARLVHAGMNVARLNMSHGTRDGHAAVLDRVRAVARTAGTAIAVLLDLQGPKMRIGALQGGSVILPTGGTVAITTRPTVGTAQVLSTPYVALPAEVRPGERILLSDGLIELWVESVEGDTVHCSIVEGGQLFERQGINLPGTTIAAPSLTEKDLADLDWGIAHAVDYVAVSFVRRPEDVLAAKERIRAAGAHIPVVAKLEKPQALERLDGILGAADAVMVARGDLGVELPAEQVPVLQKRIIAAANGRLVPVITATQMLESMVRHPRPTRAEVTDVANAIWDGTDAVMLSAETAAGEYPVEAVATMDRIARTAENERTYLQSSSGMPDRPDFPHAVGLAARAVSEALPDLAAIVAFTRDGATARLMSIERLAVPMLALTDDEAVYRRMALYWGVEPVISAAVTGMPAMLHEAERAATAQIGSAPGDTLLVVGHFPPEAPGSTNFMTLHRVGDAG